MAEIQRGIALVERHPTPATRIEQAAAQRPLQQIEPHQRLVVGRAIVAGTAPLPSRLDLPDALQHELVVLPMWPAVQRHQHRRAAASVAGSSKPLRRKS
jgi:hypothetical protein